MNSCPKCKRALSTKQCLDNHLPKCNGEIVNPLVCKGCLEIFNHNSSKNRHQKTCVAYKSLLQSEGASTSTEIVPLTNNSITTINDNHGNVANQIYNINISIPTPMVLHPYGREDLKPLLEDIQELVELLVDLASNKQNLYTTLIERIHFNRDIPQNMNVKKTNKKYPATVYNGDRFVPMVDDELSLTIKAQIRRLITSCICIVQEKYPDDPDMNTSVEVLTELLKPYNSQEVTVQTQRRIMRRDKEMIVASVHSNTKYYGMK